MVNRLTAVYRTVRTVVVRGRNFSFRRNSPTRLNDMTEENRKLKLIIFPGETVVIDEYGKRIVACPTEDEAEEYIREQEE